MHPPNLWDNPQTGICSRCLQVYLWSKRDQNKVNFAITMGQNSIEHTASVRCGGVSCSGNGLNGEYMRISCKTCKEHIECKLRLHVWTTWLRSLVLWGSGPARISREPAVLELDRSLATFTDFARAWRLQIVYLASYFWKPFLKIRRSSMSHKAGNNRPGIESEPPGVSLQLGIIYCLEQIPDGK